MEVSSVKIFFFPVSSQQTFPLVSVRPEVRPVPREEGAAAGCHSRVDRAPAERVEDGALAAVLHLRGGDLSQLGHRSTHTHDSGSSVNKINTRRVKTGMLCPASAETMTGMSMYHVRYTGKHMFQTSNK